MSTVDISIVRSKNYLFQRYMFFEIPEKGKKSNYNTSITIPSKCVPDCMHD